MLYINSNFPKNGIQFQKDEFGKVYKWFNEGVYLPEELRMYLKLQIKQDKKGGYNYNQYFHQWKLKSLMCLDTIDEIETQHSDYENSGYKLINTIPLSNEDCRFYKISSGELKIYRTDKKGDFIPTDPVGLCVGYMNSDKEMVSLKVYH